MKTAPPDVPQRITLTSQAAALIRRQVGEGRWSGPLPGERTLALQLHVSRVTVRRALADLTREGVLAVARRRRHPVAGLRQAVPRRRRAGFPSVRVGYLCPQPMGAIQIRKLGEIYELQRMLQDAAIPLTLIADPQLARLRNPARSLTA